MSDNRAVVAAADIAGENKEVAPSGRRTPDGRVPPGLAGYYVGDQRLTSLCIECGEGHPDVHEHDSTAHPSEYDYSYLRTNSEVDAPGVSCEECHRLLPTNVLVYRHGPGRKTFLRTREAITTTAHDCPDCGAMLELVDDEEAGSLALRCPDCSAMFWAYREEGDIIVETRME